jgi:hypothetical protein
LSSDIISPSSSRTIVPKAMQSKKNLRIFLNEWWQVIELTKQEVNIFE